MSESLTEGASTEAASVNEPTAEVNEQPAADVQNQEAVSQEEAASQVTTEAQTQTQTEETEPKAKVETTDDGLAKFAKAQGFDPENLTDGERRALQIARDNQRALRSSTNKEKLSESASKVDTTISPEDMTAFQQEFSQYKSMKKAEAFFSEEGRDDSLSPVMAEILDEKKAEHGAEYARVLANDLPLLYDLAQIRSGANKQAANVDPEAIRREERESINKKMSGASATQHASTGQVQTAPKVTAEWLRSEYRPGNPEHDALVAAYMAS